MTEFINGWIEDENGPSVEGEIWLPVPGFRDHYEVSTSGRVRSCDRININRNGVRRLLRGKLLATVLDGEGYPQVSLFRGDGIETKMRVHRIVAAVFVKNPRGLPLVDHRDRDRCHCAVRNLRWASYVENRLNSSQSRLAAMEDMRRLSAEGTAAKDAS